MAGARSLAEPVARSEGLSRIQSKTLGLNKSRFNANVQVHFQSVHLLLTRNSSDTHWRWTGKMCETFPDKHQSSRFTNEWTALFQWTKLLRGLSSPPSNCCCGLRLLQQTKIWLNGQTHGLERGRMNMKCEISVGLKKKKRKKKAVASFIMSDVGNLSKVPKTVTKQNLLTKAGR